MPQLDFLSFPSQSVYLTLVLAILIILLYRYVLPDLLLTVETTQALLHENQTQRQHLDTQLSKHTNLASNQTFTKFLQKLPNKDNTLSSKKVSFSQKVSLEENQAFFYHLTKKSFFLPFLTLLTPSDTFLLFLAQFTFFFLLYNFVSVRFINPAFDEELAKKEANFLEFFQLSADNAKIQYDRLQKEAFLEETSQALLAHSIHSFLQTNPTSLSMDPMENTTKKDKDLQLSSKSLLQTFHSYQFLKNQPVFPSSLVGDHFQKQKLASLFLLLQKISFNASRYSFSKSEIRAFHNLLLRFGTLHLRQNLHGLTDLEPVDSFHTK